VESPRVEKDRRQFLRESLALAAAVGLAPGLVTGCGEKTLSAVDAAASDAQGHNGDLGLAQEAATPETGLADLAPSDVAAMDAAFPTERPLTTVAQTVVGVLPAKKQAAADLAQWGLTASGSGEPHQRLDRLGVDALKGPATGAAASLLIFPHLTDIHIIDEESPARTVALDDVASSAWRRQESYSTQLLDAMIRKLVKFDAFRKLDFVLFSGDAIDNNQKNELMWFLQVVNGGLTTPNSGALDDPLSGTQNDPHDGFVAAGLGQIPWYHALGNHDGLIQGNLAFSPGSNYSAITGDPTRGEIAAGSLSRANPPVCNPIPAGESPLPARCVPTEHNKLQPGAVVVDPDREHLTRQAWFQLHLDLGGLPKGHGFTAANVQSGKGDYVAEVAPGLPLRLVVLDTCAQVSAVGAYPDDRIDGFLKPALAQALADEVLVIVVSHHPTSGIPIQGSKIRDALHSCPNVVLHLVGHGHKNQVIDHQGKTPSLSYWEVQTTSIIDWPQQARMVELVDNRDGTAEFYLTLIDFDTDHALGHLAQAGRFLALQDVQSGDGGSNGSGGVEDRNVILPVLLPDSVRQKLAQVTGHPIESLLF
jgi:hypothetical protein